MKHILVLIFSFFCFQTMSKNEVIVGTAYFNEIFGHIHMNPSKHSQSLSTIACGHPLRILKQEKDEDGFKLVKGGPYKGYIHESLLSEKIPDCIQESHPKFFDLLDLTLSDMYFWGKLQDQVVEGKSKVQ